MLLTKLEKKSQLSGAQADGPHHFEVEQAQFPVGDHEEIPAATSRVEEAQLVQLKPEGRQLLLVLPHRLELLPQFIEEQRFDEAQDVLFGGVVCAEATAFGGGQHLLEQRAEDFGADAGPVELATFEQPLAEARIAWWRLGHRHAEQSAVHVGEGLQFLRQGFAALLGRRVQYLEQEFEHIAHVLAVGLGVQGDEAAELLRAEDACVLGEEAEEHPHEQEFEVGAPVASG